jgi:hypothetical protein
MFLKGANVPNIYVQIHQLNPVIVGGGGLQESDHMDCSSRPPLGSKLNADTSGLFLNIPIDHFRLIKYIGKKYLKENIF